MTKTYIQPQIWVKEIMMTFALLTGSDPDSHMDNGGGDNPESGRAPRRIF